jgi:Rps23 Pro-64 3,4-dihydroxylase Tpa1-like proline 4-hydroxylase
MVLVDAEIKDFVFVMDDFLSADYCESMMRNMDRSFEMGFGYNRQNADKVSSLMKKDDFIYGADLFSYDAIVETSKAKEFSERFWEVAYPIYANAFPILNEMGTHTIHGTKLQRTPVGGGYHVWHCEQSHRENSQRLMTFIVYLNDIEEGGETELLYQHQRIKPKQGRLVLFPASYTHTHRGNPPLSNTKYIMTGWVEF